MVAVFVGGMARRRMIVHGSQEEMEMFEPIYNTRLRLQHGASSSCFQLPDPPTDVESQQEGEDDGAVNNNIVHTSADHELDDYEVAVETTLCWRSSDDITDENARLPDKIPRSTTETDDQLGSAKNGNTGLQAPGIGSQTRVAAASPDILDSDTGSDSD